MEHPGFYERAAPLPVGARAERVGGELAPTGDPAVLIHDVRALAEAGPGHITFLDNRKYLDQLATTQATACLVAPAFAARVPTGVTALVTAQPYRGFALALQQFYPEAMIRSEEHTSELQSLRHL